MSVKAGYFLRPSPYRPPIGHAGLDVYLAPKPSERVFDAASLCVRIYEDASRTPRTLLVTPNDEFTDRRHSLALGRFWLHDFSGHALEFFSFGGNLTITHHADLLLCRFDSSAPVFELDIDIYDVERIFVDAIESIAAVLRAEWRDGDDVEWLSNLAMVEPFSLFISCLLTVQMRLHELALATPYYVDLSRLQGWISRVIRILRQADEWPERAPTLGEMEQALSARIS